MSGGLLDLTGGTLSLVEGGQEIAQKIQARLRFFLGEWFLDQDIGIPYYQRIFQKGVTQNEVQAILQETVESIAGVTATSNWAIAFSSTTRALSISFTAETDAGKIDVNQTFNNFAEDR